MRTFLKRTLAVIMLVIMVLTSAPLSGLVGADWLEVDGMFSKKASAINVTEARDALVEYFYEMATVPWVAGANFKVNLGMKKDDKGNIYYTGSQTYYKTQEYYGLPYAQKKGSSPLTVEMYQKEMEKNSGKVSKFLGQSDCSTSLGVAYKKVFPKIEQLWSVSSFANSKYGFKPVGSVGDYSSLLPGDVLVKGSKGHVMMVVSVDKAKKIVKVIHQSSAYYTYNPSKDTTGNPMSTTDANMKKRNCSWGVNQDKTYEDLKSDKYQGYRYKSLGTYSTITFNGNGGTATKAKDWFFVNEPYNSLPSAKRTGYVFAGWYTAKTGGTKVTAKIKASAENKTLYAQWIKLPKTTFNGNGGTPSESSVYFTAGKIYGNSMPSATKNGYTFDGWYTAKTGGSRVIRSSTVPSKDMTLYAQWKKNETGVLKVGHVYRIYNKNSGLVLAHTATKNNSPVVQVKSGTAGNSELWRVVSVDSNGYYKFESLGCGRGLDVNSDSKWAYGAKLQIYDQKDHDAQRFSIINRKDNLYSIHCKNSGRAIDVSDSSKKENAALHQWDYHGGANQLFWFEESTKREIQFYDNHNNSYMSSPSEEYENNVAKERGNPTAPVENYLSRKSDYVKVTLNPDDNSIIIDALKAGSSGKDMNFRTTVNASYNYDYSEANTNTMVLKFRAKSSVAGAKIYFRWGYDGTFKSVALTKDWADYSVELPRTKNSGSSIHPYVDKVCKIEMADVGLYNKGVMVFDGDGDMYSVQKITADVNNAKSCPAPMPRAEKTGYEFDGWYTQRVGGTKVADGGDYYDVTNLKGSQKLYAHWVESACKHNYTETITDSSCTAEGKVTYTCSLCADTYTETIAKKEHDYKSLKIDPTCVDEGSVTYICSVCGHTYSEKIKPAGHINTVFVEEKLPSESEKGYTEGTYCKDCNTWIEGHEEIPYGILYRYRTKIRLTSSTPEEEGYINEGSDWSEEPIKTQTVKYAKTWPSGSSTTKGFKTDSTIYKQYNKPSVSETDTIKTVLGDESKAKTVGYLYWHWCYTHDMSGPINCIIGGKKGYKVNTYSTNNFHAFFTETALSFNSSAKAYKKSSASLCPYTYWWSGLKHGVSGNIEVIENTLYTYEKEYYHYKWSDWSDWSTDPIEETDDIEIQEIIPNAESGVCGEEAYWKFDKSSGTLTISGNGAIYDSIEYDEVNNELIIPEDEDYTTSAPWYGFKEKIKKLIVEEGITRIGIANFYSCYYLTDVQLPDTLETVGYAAFCDCIRLEKLDFPDSVKTIYDANYNEIVVRNIVLPKSLENLIPIEEEVFDFNMCVYLESVTVPKEVGAVEAVISAVNPSIRNIYNYSQEALIRFDNNAVNEGWWADEATAEYVTVAMSIALDYIGNPEILESEEAKAEYFVQKLIEHYGEDYKDKIPASVNMSENVPDYIKVYCYENSAQHKYCVENNISYILVDKSEEIKTPGITEKITASQGIDIINLSWTAVDDADGYRIYRKNATGWSYASQTDAETTSVAVEHLIPGTKYTFAVRSFKNGKDGYIWSDGYTTINTATKAVAPTKVKTRQTASAIQLIWNACNGATGYRIYVRNGNAWKSLGQVTGTMATLRNLVSGTKYTYAIRPYIITDSGVVWSDYVAYTASTLPVVPKTRVASSASGKITVSWTPTNGADVYQLFFKVGDGNYKLFKNYASAQTLSFSGLKSGTQYTFAVRTATKTTGGWIFGSYKPVSVTVK